MTVQPTTADTDVVCLGESMVTFLPARPGRLADVPSFDRAIGGAESNVACALAAAGHAAKWVSRVGADGFGEHLVEAIGAYGVDVSAVGRDASRPTGIYFRTADDREAADHEVLYYRAGSAASAMSPRTVPYEDLRAARILHLSGITAALSDDCLELMRELMTRGPGRPLVSFDVNYRPGLWRSGQGPEVLLELARGADLVFVGEDEAEGAWGLHGAEAIREALPEPATLVVKRGSAGATVFTRTGADLLRGSAPDPAPQSPEGLDFAGEGLHVRVQTARAETARVQIPANNLPRNASAHQAHSARPAIEDERPEAASGGPGATPQVSGRGGVGDMAPRSGGADRAPAQTGVAETAPAAQTRVTDSVTDVPALRVDVVAPVGAGDAFAAGFLSGTLRGLPVRDRVRHGHLMAAAALTTPADLAAPPSRAHADRLVALDDAAWGTLRLGPGWTTTSPQAAEEVRTP
ncbi:sugar kinase [Streptomyces sp. NBC_01465]|uniref:sugar kinase n=1 Tax=Streptomyces sp. NBC_01465 TaxID=2903878 RepID=UPI002E36E06F|nr:sugar kinase [Streptomyces sp. NBC_01465]